MKCKNFYLLLIIVYETFYIKFLEIQLGLNDQLQPDQLHPDQLDAIITMMKLWKQGEQQ